MAEEMEDPFKKSMQAMGLLAMNQPAQDPKAPRFPNSPSDGIEFQPPQSGPASLPPSVTRKAIMPDPEPEGGDAQEALPALDVKKSPLDGLMVTKEDLQNAADAKRRDLGLGMMLDAMGNRQSWGNFYTGKMNPHNDIMGGFKQLAAQEDEPIKQKKTLLDQAIKQPEVEMQQKMADPNSSESKISVNLAVAGISKLSLPQEQKQQLLESLNGANALQVNQLVDKNPILKDIFSQDAMGQRLQLMSAMMDERLKRQDERIDLTKQGLGLKENAAYGHEMNQTENTMLGANRALELVNKIQAKDLVGTSQLKSDLSAALGSMMNGGKPATVYGMSHQEFDSLYSRAQQSYGMLTGQTPGTITDAQLTQLKKDIQALQVEYGKQRDIKYKSFSAGAGDGAKEVFQKRHDAFDKASGEQYGEKATPETKGMVQISNGKESHMVSPSDAVEAMKEGFRVVK